MTAIIPLAIGFLAPGLFAAGAAAISIPVLIHILNRRRFRVVEWAAMNYLLAALKKNRKRLKFESLLLLLTRCAVLLLLGMALARPFGCQNNSLASFAGRRSGLHVFVIDNGYAMGYQFDRSGAKTHLEQAKLMTKQLINRLWSGSEAVAILTTASLASDARSSLPTPTYDLEAAKAMVDRIDQTYAMTDMVSALDRARQVAVATTDLPSKTLYILDDSTRHVWESKRAGALAQIGQDLSKDFASGIIHYNLGVPNEYNPLVVDLTSAQRLATMVGDFAPSFVAKLRAYGDGPSPQLVWKIDDARADNSGGGPLKLDLSDHLDTLGRAVFTKGGPHVVSATLVSDDKLPCDDTRWHVVNVASDLKMLLVEGEEQVGANGGSGLYIRAALDPDRDPSDVMAKQSRLVNIDSISELELQTRPLEDYRCIALCGVGQLNEAIAARLETFVKNGGALWVFMGPQTNGDNYNATLYKHHLLPGALVNRVIVPAGANAVADGVKFDFDPSRQVHPLLAPFYQSQGSGLENARVYSYWQVDIPPNSTAEHVLDYEQLSGVNRKDAAFTVQSLGSGRVVFCSTSADANEEWTAFPAKKAFPEVMLCLFLGTVSTDDSWMNLSIGDVVRPPATLKMTTVPQLKDAAGVNYPLGAQTIDDGTAFTSRPLIKPGVYTMTAGTDTYPIVVNVPAEEGDTRLVESEAIRKALGAINIDFQQDVVPHEAAARVEEAKDFGWSIMLAVLALASAESFMAMKFGRFKRTTRSRAAA